MKSTILVIVIVVSFIPVSGQQNVSRFGLIEIKDNDEGKHKLLLDGKEIFQYEGQSIEIAGIRGTKVSCRKRKCHVDTLEGKTPLPHTTFHKAKAAAKGRVTELSDAGEVASGGASPEIK